MSKANVGVSDVLNYVRNVVLALPRNWTKGALARRGAGATVATATMMTKGSTKDVSFAKSGEDCFCTIGGVEKAIYDLGLDPNTGEGRSLRNDAVIAVAKQIKPGVSNVSDAESAIITFNDNSLTTFAKVSDTFKLASQAA